MDEKHLTIPKGIGGEDLEVEVLTRPGLVPCPTCKDGKVVYDHAEEGRHAADVMYQNVCGSWLWAFYGRLQVLYHRKEDS